MTREEFSRTLRYMEQLRMDSYEAETPREMLRMKAEYKQLEKSIEPYCRAGNPLPFDGTNSNAQMGMRQEER